MGIEANVGFDRFPKQGFHLGETVRVCFSYDTSRQLSGVIVRDDTESPWRTIIRLDDGRFIEAAECQYQLTGEVPAPEAASREMGEINAKVKIYEGLLRFIGTLKPWTVPPELKLAIGEAQKQIDRLSAPPPDDKTKWPVGTVVIVELDDGTEARTVTRSEPWELGDLGSGRWVVKVKGVAGGYALSRMRRA